MKSVGIITFQWYDNYGTVLQAYALQTTLCKLGYDARIVPIDFNPVPGLKRYVAKSISGTLGRWNKILAEHGNRRRDQFTAFRRRFFKYVEMPHVTFSEALTARIPCDCLVFGSDNIWSPWCVHHDDDMSKLFLGDGIHHPCKIVYAASTGGRISRHPRSDESLMRIMAAGFRSISLREEANLDFFKKGGLDVVQVPDPSLLLSGDAWRHIALSGHGRRPYVMGYDLGHHGAFPIRAVCDDLARDCGWEVKIPYPKKWQRDYDVSCCPGPQEWIALIRDAKLLVTNSFHGVMFALLFNRPFVFLEIDGNEEARELNMRAKEILALVELSSRVVPSTAKRVDEVRRVAVAPIDWNAVNAKMEEFRQVGFDYLKGALTKGVR